MTRAPNGGPPGPGRRNHRDSVCAGRPEASWFQAGLRRSVQLIAEGRLLISAGTRPAPLMAGLGPLARCGEVQVRPRAGVVVAGGGELRTSGLPSAPGAREAPGPALTGLVSGPGGEVIQVRYADDSEDDLADALAQAGTHASRLLAGGDGGTAALVLLAAGPAS